MTSPAPPYTTWPPSGRPRLFLTSRIVLLPALAAFACLSTLRGLLLPPLGSMNNTLLRPQWSTSQQQSPPARILHHHQQQHHPQLNIITQDKKPQRDPIHELSFLPESENGDDDGADDVDDDDKNDDVMNLWDDSTTTIPSWMKRYFAWHKAERATLTRDNWTSRRYLVLRCLATDTFCGGASDRLKPIPYLLLVANQTQRLLLIMWSRPAPLEEFLIPPLGGMNWTVPNEIVADLQPYLRGRVGNDLRHRNQTNLIYSEKSAFWAHTDQMVVEARLSTSLAGDAYDQISGGKGGGGGGDDPDDDDKVVDTFDNVYGDVWRVLFEPTPPIARRIAYAQRQLQLTPGQYVSVHLRAQYIRNNTNNQKMIVNALHCAASLIPVVSDDELPVIYVASDSTAAVRYAVEYGRNALNRTIVAHVRDDSEPLHLDRGTDFLSHPHANWDQYQASDYYDTFVDLYLLGGGRCTTYGIGGYGHWASLLSADPQCAVRHTERQCPVPPSVRSSRRLKGRQQQRRRASHEETFV